VYTCHHPKSKDAFTNIPGFFPINLSFLGVFRDLDLVYASLDFFLSFTLPMLLARACFSALTQIVNSHPPTQFPTL